MADPTHLSRLKVSLSKPSGRKDWLEFKLRISFIDLSTADLTEQPLANYDFSDCDLSSSILLGADLGGADLSDAKLTYADLRRALLRNALLDRADLSGANLQGADFVDACLEHARLAKCRMMEANLVGVDLSDADLTGADLRGASLKYARLAGARLAGANVAGADLTGAVMDDRAPAVLVNFHQAFVDDRKYREMRSRLAASAGRELVTVAKSDEPPLAESGGERDRARDEKKGQKKTIPASLARGSSATPLDFGKVRFESGIPIREREPDLSSTGACCQMLEIPAGATTEEVAKAFRTKAKLYHPDKTRHLSERLQQLAAEEFQRVFRAYEMLTRRTTRPLVGIRWAEGVPYHETPYEYTVEEYEKLSAVNPGNTSILYNLAWKYFEASQYQDSIQGFQRVLEINPSDDDASYNLMIVRLFVELQLPAPL